MAEKHHTAQNGADSAGAFDPLGEVIEQYHVTWASVLLVSGAIAALGSA